MSAATYLGLPLPVVRPPGAPAGEPVIVPLSKSFATYFGTPAVSRIDTSIFTRTSFIHCMKCDFCHDSCCQYGADVDADNHVRLLGRSADLGAYLGIPSEQWFTNRWTPDAEYPAGRNTRTAVKDGACVFLNRSGRGCRIHTFCLENGEDYHTIKPMICSLFPLTFDGGLLRPAYELITGELVCIGAGPTLYEGSRDEVLHYFGAELTAELDGLQAAARRAAGV